MSEIEKFAHAYGSCFGGADVDKVKEVLDVFELSSTVESENVQIVDAWLLWHAAKAS